MGRVYATAAVAYGRVFIGSLDGRVYAFSTRNGHRRWSRTTGGYVYASAAVSRGKVFVGSYDGRFYALSARSGRVVWAHNTGGRISGSATVIGNIVYFSDLGHRMTIGLWTKSGRRAFHRSLGRLRPGDLRRQAPLPHRPPHADRATAAQAQAPLAGGIRGRGFEPAAATGGRLSVHRYAVANSRQDVRRRGGPTRPLPSRR